MAQVTTKNITNSTVTNAKLAVMNTLSLKGNNSLVTSTNPSDLSIAQVNVMLSTLMTPMQWNLTGSYGLLGLGVTNATQTTENGMYVYSFPQSTYVSTVLQVPQTYVLGNPIRLRNCVYSSSTTGTLLFQTTSLLIRTGTDAVTATTNKRVSTNAAITLTASTVNIPQPVVYDITDTTGRINNISVNPGDQILIMLVRSATDTSTATPRCMVLSTIPTFS